MKANELRIGNFVKGEGYPILVIVELFTSIECEGKYRIIALQDSIDDNRDKIIGLITEIEPIELTEEWLLKFGFRKSHAGKKLEDLKEDYEEVTYVEYYVRKDITICNWFNDCGFIRSTQSFREKRQSIKFVHQLQNLYFALIGEELTLN